MPVFVTWRLPGTLPLARRFPVDAMSGHVFFAMDRLLDVATTGPRYLAMPEIAGVIAGALRFSERELGHFELHAWVVMANHVHILITPKVRLCKAMHSLKRFTAKEANRVLCLTGQPFWQDESFDRVVRNADEFARIRRYIEMNPVRAGLVAVADEFGWSSAGLTPVP